MRLIINKIRNNHYIQKYPVIKQFIKFSVVGFTGTIVDLSIYNLLAIGLGINIYLSRTISFILAANNNYTLNRIWTFRSKEKRVTRQFGQFFFISLIGWGLNLLIMRVLQPTVSGIENEVFKKNIPVIIAIIIVLFWNFFANKHWTFRNKNI